MSRRANRHSRNVGTIEGSANGSSRRDSTSGASSRARSMPSTSSWCALPRRAATSRAGPDSSNEGSLNPIEYVCTAPGGECAIA
jgi:hypothetical protein